MMTEPLLGPEDLHELEGGGAISHHAAREILRLRELVDFLSRRLDLRNIPDRLQILASDCVLEGQVKGSASIDTKSEYLTLGEIANRLVSHQTPADEQEAGDRGDDYAEACSLAKAWSESL